MELPIRIIITFFVAVTVASLLIVFSRNILKNAQGDLSALSAKDKIADDQKIIELHNFDDAQIASLAVECYRLNYGHSLVKVLCYSVHDDSGAGGATAQNVVDIIKASPELKSNVSVTAGFAPSDYALRISYDPAIDTIELKK
jgi:hypothetical protein